MEEEGGEENGMIEKEELREGRNKKWFVSLVV